MNQQFGGGSLSGLASLFEAHELPTQQEEQSTLVHSKRDQPSEDQSVLAALGPKRILRLAITRAGRGGKTVTTLKTTSHSSPEERKSLAKALGHALGCRTWIEDDFVIAQGDQIVRIKKWVAEQL